MPSQIGPPRAHILQEEIDDEIVLYDPEQRRYVSLNATASDVWRLADGELTVDEITELLANAYGAKPEQIVGDVQRIVTELAEAALLEAPPADA